MVSELRVGDVDEGDIDDIARLHVEAFPDSVLGRLGEEAVRRNYLWQLRGPHDLTALVAVHGDQVVGFLFGGVFRGSTIGFVKRERWFLARRVATHPQILLRSVGWNRLALGARLLVRRTPTHRSENPDVVPPRSFGVLSIAVDPAAQGRGVGAALMTEARRRAECGGFERMHLSVHPDNRRALDFYRAGGWTELLDPDGSWSGRMTCLLSNEST